MIGLKQLFLTLLAVLLSSCAGYKIGPAKPAFLAKINSLAVPIFINETLEPRIEALVTDTVIQQIQQDGTFKIESEANADAILEGRIDTITRVRTRAVRGNVDASSEFSLRLTIFYKLTDRVTGEMLATEKILGTTSFFVGADLQQQERQAVVLAAQDAAVRLTSKISEGW